MSGRLRNCCRIGFRLPFWTDCMNSTTCFNQSRIPVKAVEGHYQSFQGVPFLLAAFGQFVSPHRVAPQHITYPLRLDLPDLLVEPVVLKDPLLDQRLDLGLGNRSDVMETDPLQILDLSALDQAPIADQRDVAHAKALAELVDLRLEGLWVLGITRQDLDADRAPLGVRETPHDHLLLAPLTVAVVAIRPELIVLAFQIAAGHIVQIQALGELRGTLAIQRLLNSGLLIG